MVICSSSVNISTSRVTLDSLFIAMEYIWLKALWLILLNLPRSKAVNCLNLKERCKMSEDECAGLWATAERMCDLSGGNCQPKSLMNCNLTLFYFTERYPDFKSCTCSDDIYCTIKKLLGKNCNSKSVPTIPAGPLKQEHPNIQKEFMPKISVGPSSGKANDCISAKILCKKDYNCLSLYENFKMQCMHPHECVLNDAVQSCLTAWNELKKTVMGNCICLNSTKRKCLKVWNSIYNNTCLQHNLDSYSSQGTLNLDWGGSSLRNIEFGGPKSCLDVAALCVGDSVCNRHLAGLMKACPVNRTACNVKDCKRTIRAFYETMPFNMSQMLAFCNCDQSHEACQHAGSVLHSKSCTGHSDVSISCLHVVHSCLDNELCRERYGVYQSKCWEPLSRCHNNRSCLLGLHKEDLTCSGSDECRAAYIRTLGTKLQIPCTCHRGLNYEEQHLCGLFSHTLNNTSCLKRFTTNNIQASYSNTQGEQLRSGSPNIFSADAVFYILISGIILLTLVQIVLLTLLQIRACKAQKKTAAQRGNVSQSLINS
ncbi:GDNF family receptor alpha-like [Hyla sarda]|uniref:GDNF family receptor alpha-like n=1 Tax=Hyla sarda TaxID=327740 RepID=UPI0024C2811F|nr:GDNF family receptor alpha-like [Hyla sarda]